MKSFPTYRFDRGSKSEVENWRDLSNHVPFIALDADWTIAIIPSFAGAAARFLVRDGCGASVSVYLDTCEALGCSDVIYWEVYPGPSGEIDRCAMEAGDELLELIRGGLEKARSEL